jgi:chemotaxis protein MotB
LSTEAKAPPQIIIIKKKVHAHGGHHGGAWKVAYADFVTAMMALFIVLWLLSSSQKIQKAVGGYFVDPSGKGRETGSTNAGIGENLTLNKDNMEELKDKLDQLMRQMPAFESMKDQIQMTVTSEGLRIDLMETSGGLFFELGSPTPTEAGRNLLKLLCQEVGKLPNRIAIEGHTDAKPFQRESYSNWELSSDRANSARRIMQESGLRPDQVNQVRGFADQRLRLKKEPTNPSNRRISIIIRNPQVDIQEEAAMAARGVAKDEKRAPAAGDTNEAHAPAAAKTTHH